MSLSRPYFNNIKDIGNLDVEYIIFQADYPVLFTLRDKFNELYLCLCCDIRKEQRWIISKTTVKIVIDMLCNKITLYDAFKSPYNKNYIVKWSYETQREESYEVLFDNIDELDLPVQGEYIDSIEDEFKDYINQLEMRKNNYEAIPFELRPIKTKLQEISKIHINNQCREREKYGDIWNLIYQNVINYFVTDLKDEYKFKYCKEDIDIDLSLFKFDYKNNNLKENYSWKRNMNLLIQG